MVPADDGSSQRVVAPPTLISYDSFSTDISPTHTRHESTQTFGLADKSSVPITTVSADSRPRVNAWLLFQIIYMSEFVFMISFHAHEFSSSLRPCLLTIYATSFSVCMFCPKVYVTYPSCTWPSSLPCNVANSQHGVFLGCFMPA